MPNCHSGFCRARRRCDEIIRTVKKLDQLTEALNYEGYDLMRSFLYPHLLVRNSQILEGMRHVHTTPAKLYKSQNSKHSSHISTKFTQSSIRTLEEIAAILRPEEVPYHSLGDKAKVTIGITATKKQTQLLIHMKYQVALPDHGFVVGSKHKLIPSVVSDMKDVKSKYLTNDVIRYYIHRNKEHKALWFFDISPTSSHAEGVLSFRIYRHFSR